MNRKIILMVALILGALFSCQIKEKKVTMQTIGSIVRLDDEIDKLIPPDAVIQVLAEGFDWSEGPLWIPGSDYLIFSDIPPNRIYKWSEDDSIELFLEPSGYTGDVPFKGEPGSNGLVLDPDGALVLCQHGDRRIARMDAPLSNPEPLFTSLADNFEGKRLNSPNDACYDSKGNLYFTDPPYGLPGNMDDPAKELDFQGVYRLAKDGTLNLLTNELSRPNGIALSPDEHTLYVANSDAERAIWMAYDLLADGTVDNGRIFFDVNDKVDVEMGLPDGMKVNSRGYIFATGPGGVWIFNPDGKHLGTIKTTQATANCAFNTDESILYITADMYLLKVGLKLN